MCFLEIFCQSRFLFVKGKKLFAFIFTFCFSFGFAVFIHYILSGPFIHILFSCAMLFMMLLFFIDQQAIWQQNNSNVPVDPVLEIPPEFDPDSAEFISDISDYATDYRKKDIVQIPLEFDSDVAEMVSDTMNSAAKQHWEQMEIPLEFDTDASELVSDIWHHEANQQLGQFEASLEFDPDTSELAPDITEYTIKLKQVC